MYLLAHNSDTVIAHITTKTIIYNPLVSSLFLVYTVYRKRMRLFQNCLHRRREDPEAVTAELQEYQVQITPPVPLPKRIKQKIVKGSRRICCCLTSSRPLAGSVWFLVFFILIGEFLLFLLSFYYSYKTVFPGSKAAANINKNSSTTAAYVAFYWFICSGALLLTVPAAYFLYILGVKFVREKVGYWLSIPFSLLWLVVCASLGTWEFWISWVLGRVWTDLVWNGACSNWDMTVVLEGVSWKELPTSLPYVGIATVVLANNRGNYTLQMIRNDIYHEIFTLYKRHVGTYTPPLGNITYNSTAYTYDINNMTSYYVMDPNLSFPSLNMSLADPSIPFANNWGPPVANLVYHNDSAKINVLKMITSSYDCQNLKLCASLEREAEFQIALGVAMIQEFQFVVRCTTPSSS